MQDPDYAVTEGVLDPRECDALMSALARGGRPEGQAGVRHLMRIPEIAEIAADPRLLHLAEKALGGRAVPYRATLFEKTRRANWLVAWHQDTILPLVSRVASDEWGPWTTKAGVLHARAPAWALERVIALRVHLDASTHENGPLRVIPGSHRAGVLSDEDILSMAHHNEAVECLVGRGGVVAMRPLLIHASSKALTDQPRRVVHIEYSDGLDLGDGVRLALA
jgi:ectoine hydroxylase-related dioxygenase (phytanoyl-CoA dioxygenase family)